MRDRSALTEADLTLAADLARANGFAWRKGDFEKWRSDPMVVFIVEPAGGFVFGRVVVDEAELFLVATNAIVRRQGIARRLVCRFEADAQALGARRVFLEVRSANTAAQALYTGLGYQGAGIRRGYYPDGEDAVLLAKDLA